MWYILKNIGVLEIMTVYYYMKVFCRYSFFKIIISVVNILKMYYFYFMCLSILSIIMYVHNVVPFAHGDQRWYLSTWK